MGLALGAVQAASPLILGWLEPATLHALYISLIAAVYIGRLRVDAMTTPGRHQALSPRSAELISR